MAEITNNGQRYLAAAKPLNLPGLSWNVLAQKQVAEIERPIRAMLNKSLLVCIGLGLGIAGISWWFSKCLANNIHHVCARVEDIAKAI